MREKLLMNRDWHFYLGEPEYLPMRREMSDQTYRGTRAANARGPARRDFDDEAWETVSLPHDFVALHGISETDPHGGEHFDFPMDRGSAWYRRYFELEEADKGRRIVLHFEGMGTFCEVYVNSMLLRTHRTNGIGFDVDITDIARFGFEQNVVAVHCDCHDFEAWYYEGGGITRNVWLVKTDLVSVDLWGTFVRSERISDTKWHLLIDTDVRNDTDDPQTVCVSSRVLRDETDEAEKSTDPSVFTASEALKSEPVTIPPRAVKTVSQCMEVENPALWSPKSPALYQLYTEVSSAVGHKDCYQTQFGIREISYDPDHGMFVNGDKTRIYGFANHMLYLGVGEAMTPSMCEYQIRTLHEMGSNGYRTAHSPHHEETMNWCDRYGQLVMDENRIFHSSEIVKDEVERLIKRDRNHPSVCMWSVYNEEDTVTNETGRRIFKTLKALVNKLDPTRPVSGATSYGMFSEGVHEDYDLFGFNHQTMNLEALHHMKLDKPIYCSEMIIPLGRQREFQGLEVRTGEDAHTLEKEYMIGGFHFTAWGYGPERPEILGMEGTPGVAYYGFKAFLRPDEPFAKIFLGWDFTGKEGQEVELNLANNGDSVEIILNGKSVRTVETDPYAITPVKLVYEPGELRIAAYKDGKIWAEDRAVTPGKPAGIELVAENRSFYADGSDAAIISAYLVDRDGNRCLRETGWPITFTSEDGELITTLSLRDDLYQGKVGETIRCFDGKCQALYRVPEGMTSLTVKAEAPGLSGAEITVEALKAPYADVPDCPSDFVNGWRISAALPAHSEDRLIMKKHEIERYLPIDTLGTPVVEPQKERGEKAEGLSYVYYKEITIPEMQEKDGEILALRFEGIDGKANIYITDGEKTDVGHHKGDSPWFGHYRPELIVPCDSFKPGDHVEIWVFMHDVGRVHGIGWPVHFMYTTPEEIRALDEKTDREWSYYLYREPKDE